MALFKTNRITEYIKASLNNKQFNNYYNYTVRYRPAIKQNCIFPEKGSFYVFSNRRTSLCYDIYKINRLDYS